MSFPFYLVRLWLGSMAPLAQSGERKALNLVVAVPASRSVFCCCFVFDLMVANCFGRRIRNEQVCLLHLLHCIANCKPTNQIPERRCCSINDSDMEEFLLYTFCFKLRVGLLRSCLPLRSLSQSPSKRFSQHARHGLRSATTLRSP